MSNINSDFISTEIDLDRDVPNQMGWDVDVDENGPFITSSFDDTDTISISDCCGEELPHSDYAICGVCHDHCGVDEVSEFDFDEYCGANPEFNAALNGHPNFV
tara:strand:- start:29 stop:337 length:309 start_codon:yes stop_codon:yes gene_type:complete